MTPWTAAGQASLSFTLSQSLLKLMSIESVMPSNHLVLCRPLFLLPSIFPSIILFSNELALCIRWQSIGASASVLLMNVYSWFPLGLTGLISLYYQIRSDQSLSRAQLFPTPRTAAPRAPLSFTLSQSLLKLMSIELVMPSNHLTLWRPLLLLPSIFPSIRVFSNESALHIR